jgi:hypothetical protein
MKTKDIVFQFYAVSNPAYVDKIRKKKKILKSWVKFFRSSSSYSLTFSNICQLIIHRIHLKVTRLNAALQLK